MTYIVCTVEVLIYVYMAKMNYNGITYKCMRMYTDVSSLLSFFPINHLKFDLFFLNLFCFDCLKKKTIPIYEFFSL